MRLGIGWKEPTSMMFLQRAPIAHASLESIISLVSDLYFEPKERLTQLIAGYSQEERKLLFEDFEMIKTELFSSASKGANAFILLGDSFFTDGLVIDEKICLAHMEKTYLADQKSNDFWKPGAQLLSHLLFLTALESGYNLTVSSLVQGQELLALDLLQSRYQYQCHIQYHIHPEETNVPLLESLFKLYDLDIFFDGVLAAKKIDDLIQIENQSLFLQLIEIYPTLFS